MKKALRIILFFALLFIMPVSAKAESDWEFKGTVTPKYEFMVGDEITTDDFILDGELTNGTESFQSDNIYIYTGNIVTSSAIEKQDYILELSHKRDFTKRCDVSVSLSIQEFKSTLIHPKEPSPIVIDRIHWKSEDGFDTIVYHDEWYNSMTNYYGKPVYGEMRYSGTLDSPKLGYNTVNYRFTPYDKRYQKKYGELIVIYKTKPYMVIGKDYINLQVKTSSYDIYLNGKKQTDKFMAGLKPKTKYKIVVKQKIYGDKKNVTVWSGTVTTKNNNPKHLS